MQHLPYEVLPPWRQENAYIQTGYRTQMNVMEAVTSTFRWHNETINIWTHLLALLACLVTYMCQMVHMPNFVDRCLLTLFFIGPLAVFTSSTALHIFMCCSPSIHECACKCDYVGILIGYWCSTSCFCILFFHTDAIAYIALITLLTMVSIRLVLYERFQQNEFRVCRTILFVSLGFFFLLPLSQFVTSNTCRPLIRAVLHKVAIWATSFLVGVVFYARQVPERCFPGHFDYIGHSHQIWHVFVVVGFAFQYWMVRDLLRIQHAWCPTKE